MLEKYVMHTREFNLQQVRQLELTMPKLVDRLKIADKVGENLLQTRDPRWIKQ